MSEAMPAVPLPAESGPQPAPAPAPVAPAPGALAAVPRQDLVRDLVAGLALIWSLFLMWDFSSQALATPAALIAILVSLLSLGLSYVARAGIWRTTPRTVRQVRLVANLPLVIVVIVYVLIDVFAGASSLTDWLSGYSDLSGGIGAAVPVALAGALLAAQPRQHELQGPRPEPGPARLWRIALLATGVVVIVSAVLAIVVTAVDSAETFRQATDIPLLAGYIGLLVALPCGCLVVRTYRGSGAWRIATVAFGAGIGLALALTLPVALGFGLEAGMELISSLLGEFGVSIRSSMLSVHWWGSAVVFVPALGAVAASPALAATLRPATQAGHWAGAARASFWVVAAIGVIRTLGMAVGIGVLDTFDSGGQFTASLVLWIIALAASVFGLVMLRQRVPGTGGAPIPAVPDGALPAPAQAAPGGAPGMRTKVLAAAAVLVLLGLVGLVLGLTGVMRFSVIDFAIYFAMPAVVIYAFLVVPGLKDLPGGLNLGSVGRPVANPGYGVPGYGQPAPQPVPAPDMVPPPPPQVDSAPPAPPVADPVAAEAANPATAPARLATIAQDYPHCRALVAANPRCYPGLADWLAALGDPDVTAALRQRG